MAMKLASVAVGGITDGPNRTPLALTRSMGLSCTGRFNIRDNSPCNQGESCSLRKYRPYQNPPKPVAVRAKPKPVAHLAKTFAQEERAGDGWGACGNDWVTG